MLELNCMTLDELGKNKRAAIVAIAAKHLEGCCSTWKKNSVEEWTPLRRMHFIL